MTDYIYRLPVYKAIQYDGQNYETIKAFGDEYEDWAISLTEDGTPVCLDGAPRAIAPGDWIIGEHTADTGDDLVHVLSAAAFATQLMPAPWNPAPGQRAAH